jgi:hypothetical protein
MKILVWLWLALLGSLFVLGKYLKAHRPDLFDEEGRFRVKIEPAVIPLLVGLFLLWGFGYETLWTRLITQLEGVVIFSRDIPSTSAPRHATEYLVRGPDGVETPYIAGPTDAYLPQGMPVGTSVKKLRWRTDYERNGQRVDNFNALLYMLFVGIGAACLVWSSFLWARRGQRSGPFVL